MSLANTYKEHWMYPKPKPGMRLTPKWAYNEARHKELESLGYSHEFFPFNYTFNVLIDDEDKFKHYVKMGVYPQDQNPMSMLTGGRMSSEDAKTLFKSTSTGMSTEGRMSSEDAMTLFKSTSSGVV